MTYRYQLITVSHPQDADSRFTELDMAAKLCGLHPGMVEEFLRGDLVTAFRTQNGTIYFDESGISRLRQLAHLRQHEQVSLRMTRYIVGLLDRLESQEKELHNLRERFR